jgi:hypothetical protein
MAANHPASSHDDVNKHPLETGELASDQTQHGGRDAAHLQYDVEQVERVYKKLDRRIIPGTQNCSYNPKRRSPSLTKQQLSGSSTSSVLPFGPTLVSLRP